MLGLLEIGVLSRFFSCKKNGNARILDGSLVKCGWSFAISFVGYLVDWMHGWLVNCLVAWKLG